MKIVFPRDKINTAPYQPYRIEEHGIIHVKPPLCVNLIFRAFTADNDAQKLESEDGKYEDPEC